MKVEPKSYRYLHLDVFTDRIFSGNQLAVYFDASDLPAETMQAVAREMNFAETVFVVPAERPSCDARLRIFTPTEELPMAGHPTIGSTFAMAHAGRITPSQQQITLDLKVGPTPISLEWRDETLAFAWMTQPRPKFADELTDTQGAAASLGLAAAAVADARLPVQVVSCGVPFLFIPLASRSFVDAAKLDAQAYANFRARASIDELPVFLFTKDSGADIDDDATVYSRMFAPGFGIVEDAATGGASGPLGCYLVRHRAVSREKAGNMLSLQGVRMGRPSKIHIAIDVKDEDITNVRIGGTAIIAGEGILYI